MTTALADIQGTQTNVRIAPSWSGGYTLPGTRGWYENASGGFILETSDAWKWFAASRIFPRITSSSRIDRRQVRFVVHVQNIFTLPVARQVRELQAALSVNKSELARILRVTRPTVYDWLDGGEPNTDNVARIRALLQLFSEARISASDPLFPRFVRSSLEPGGRSLLDALCEETIVEATVKNAIHRAKALGDAMDTRREIREARLRQAGFDEPDAGQRKANLAANAALMAWPRE